MESAPVQFEFDPKKPIVIESWMQKANIKAFERWQRRLFRLQGRVIFYFKKEKEPPCGFIPLTDVKVEDLKPRKGRNFGFSINIHSPHQVAKRTEYLICADTDEVRKQWKQKIIENQATTIVGRPLSNACTVHPFMLNVHLLVPYFFRSIFQAIEERGLTSHGIWILDPPPNQAEKYEFLLNMNYEIPLSDVHLAAACIRRYLLSPPDSLIPSTSGSVFEEEVTYKSLREVIVQQPATTREVIRLIGLNLRKVLDNTSKNGVTIQTLIPVFGPVFFRPTQAQTLKLTPAKARGVQAQILTTFLNNLPTIVDDIHQFNEAFRLPVIEKARVTDAPIAEDNILEVPKGLLVSVVAKDPNGWCTVYTTNRKIGLIHSSFLCQVSTEESNLSSVSNSDSLFDFVREKNPEMMLLFDAMQYELNIIQQLENA